MTLRTACLALLAAAALAGCGGVRVTAENAMPRPLVEELPLNAGLYYSAEFRNYTASEERFKTKWQVVLGPAHVAAIERLAKAMFASVTPVADLAKLPTPPLDVVLEPRFEEYSFLTPRDAGAELYAVTIKYRINLYDGAGHPIDSLVLTGFGNETADSLSSSKPLAVATRKAMRDAGAKFTAEFPEQPVVRKLVPAYDASVRNTRSSSVGWPQLSWIWRYSCDGSRMIVRRPAGSCGAVSSATASSA